MRLAYSEAIVREGLVLALDAADRNLPHTSIYNRILTASEIQQNYNATKSRFGL
jgi:hypothetical protein